MGSRHAGVGIAIGTNQVTVLEHATNYLIASLVWEGNISSWTHIAVVYENRQPKLYINGVLVKVGLTSSKTYVHPSLGYDGYPDYTSMSGFGTGMTGSHYKGLIDAIRISDTVRYDGDFTPSISLSKDAHTIGLFNFNEGSGNIANDESVNENNGVIYGATWSTDIPNQISKNYSLKLDWHKSPSGCYMEIPYSTSINSYAVTNQFTLSLWYKPLGNHSGWNWYLRKSIGNCQDDIAFGHAQSDTSNYSYLMLGNPRSCTGDQVLEDMQTGMEIGNWYHIEANYDVLKGVAQIYINGQLQAQTNSFSNITANQIITYILYGMDGLIDELHFSKIIRHTQNFIPLTEETADTNTIFLFKMNEGSGNVLVDASSNHNNATIIDPAYIEGWSTDLPNTIIANVKDKSNHVPNEFHLFQNYPNPFNPSTTIHYEIPNSGFVELKIYDELGREVKTLISQNQFKGGYDLKFNATNLSSGIYFYQLKVGSFISTKKMLLLK